MTEESPSTPPEPSPAPSTAPARKPIQPAKAFAALGNPVRWAAFQMLAKSGAMPASQVAKHLKRDFYGVSKHLRLMRSAGVLASRRGKEDARLEFYYIPSTLLRADGAVDLGFCVIRAPQATTTPPP